MRSLFVLAVIAAAVPAQKEYGFDNAKASGQPYLSPEETVKRMKVPAEFEVKLFAGEPMVANPIAFTIDERGRVWVVECFEYPNRTPKGKMPRDRIVILEDTDGDGACDKRTIFAEGKDFPERFDMASGIEVGHDGVFLGAPPYLWFIENKNDKPGKFEKLLSGFGSQDTHETLNTFQWGPDGWLYGLHGIFTNSTVKPLDGPETRMNAAVWRYHPITRKFEIFAEGTSNPWGMDWRNTDGQFILCCCVIPHLYHIVPGGIYQRQAGASFNPYAYGYIKEICDHTFHKESGWAHAGLISLDVPHMPERFRNSVIFGSIHGCSLKQNILKPNGSTYIASKGEDFLVSGDKNVRPINLRWGPHGDIYMIDWHDQNPCHQAKADSWDYERGRIYRIALKGRKKQTNIHYKEILLTDLIRMAYDGLPYERRSALRIIYENGLDKSKHRKAMEGIFTNLDGSLAINSFALFSLSNAIGNGGFRPVEQKATEAGIEAIRRTTADWAMCIRYINDKSDLSPIAFQNMEYAAKYFKHPELRREIASAAIRHADTKDTISVIHEMLLHSEDAGDALIPHLTWIAYEKSVFKPGNVATLNAELQWLLKNYEGNRLVSDFIIPRMMRRLADSDNSDQLKMALAFVKDASGISMKGSAISGLQESFKGRTLNAPAEWKALREQLLALKDDKITASVNALSVSFRDPEAIKKAVETMMDIKQSDGERITAIRQLGVLKDKETHGPILVVASKDPNPAIRIEAVRAAGAMDGELVPAVLLGLWSKQPPEVKAEIISVLASRKAWAKELLKALQVNQVERQLVTDNIILRIQAFKDKELDELIGVAWGKTRPTPADLAKQIDSMRKELESGTGTISKGKIAFENHCAKCHKFDGKGSEVGPALDGAARDIEYLLANVLDPNRVIGSPYFVRQAVTEDGQVIQGVLAEEDERTVTLKVENGVLKKLEKSKLDGPVKVLERSIMPEGLTAGMKPQDFRDLVKYLMKHPFPGVATVNGLRVEVPVAGLIPLPEAKERVEVVIEFDASEEMKTKLMLGSANEVEVILDGKAIAKIASNERKTVADRDAVEVSLAKGKHSLKLIVGTKWAGPGLYVRFLDPERRLEYR